MSEQPVQNADILVSYTAGEGKWTAAEIESEIARIWSELVGSEEGRAELAHALGVRSADLAAAQEAPLRSGPDASGFLGVDVVVAVHWAAINIGIPVLVGLAKDEVKARLAQAWRMLFKPAIEAGERKLGEAHKPLD